MPTKTYKAKLLSPLGYLFPDNVDSSAIFGHGKENLVVAVSFPTVQRYQNSQQLGRQTGIYEIIFSKEQQLALHFRVPPSLAGEESKSVVGSLHLSPQSAIPNREGGRSSDGEINNGEADDGGGEETFRVSGSTLQSVEIEASGPHAGRSRSPTSANFLLREGDAHFFIKQVPTCQSA